MLAQQISTPPRLSLSPARSYLQQKLSKLIELSYKHHTHSRVCDIYSILELTQVSEMTPNMC